MENRNRAIEELNDIVEKSYDAANGYRKAAEKTKNTELMGFFNEQAMERDRFIEELKQEVRALGGEPKEDGTIAGAAHRAWINFKTALSFDKDESILEACETGEENCIKEYNDLLEENYVPASTRALLERQKMSVQNSLAKVKLMEEAVD